MDIFDSKDDFSLGRNELSKGEIQDRFRQFVESEAHYGNRKFRVKISESQLFWAVHFLDDSTACRKFYLVDTTDPQMPHFFCTTQTLFQRGSSGVFWPVDIQVTGEVNTKSGELELDIDSRALPSDYCRLGDYYGKYYLEEQKKEKGSPRYYVHIGFAHKGSLEAHYDSDSRLVDVESLKHVRVRKNTQDQGDNKAEPVEEVAGQLGFLKRYIDMAKLSEGVDYGIKEGDYRYRFVAKEGKLIIQVFANEDLKNTISIPLRFDYLGIVQKMFSLGVLADPFNAPPSPTENNYLTDISRSLGINWVSELR